MAESKQPRDESDSKGSEDVFEMYCEGCHREELRVIACAFCSACVSYFCSTCLKYHGKFFPGHKPQQGDNMPQDVCIEKCETHNNEILKYFCTTCKTFVCSICKAEQHSETCNMKYLPDYVTDFETREELKELMTRRTDIAKRLLDYRGEIEAEYKSISSSATKVKDVIKKEKESILVMFVQFDDELSKLEEMIQDAQTKDTLAIDRVKETFALLHTETDNMSDKIKTFKQFPKSRKYMLFIEMKQLIKRLGKMNDSVDDLIKEPSKRDKTFENEVIEQSNDLIKRVKEFGKCIAESHECVGKRERKTISFVEDIEVKDSLDRQDCCVSDLCFLLEQYLVMVDKGNCCLKLFDLKRKKFLHRRLVKGTPDAVTNINDTEIAMVRLNEKDDSRSIIQFLKFTLAKQLVFTNRRIHTEIYCPDIKYIGDDKLVIALTADYSGKVQILNLNGRIIQTFDKYENGQDIFSCPYYINVGVMDKNVYISDWLNDKLYTIDIKARTTSETAHYIWHPLGIASDKDGSLYVCEEGTGRIHVFHTDDAENSAKQVLLHYDEYVPKAVHLSMPTSKLYVTFDGADFVKVYKMINS